VVVQRRDGGKGGAQVDADEIARAARHADIPCKEPLPFPYPL
jgi:hypothetical protein